MPTKKELQEKINELEEENKILFDNMITGKELLDELVAFVKAVNLADVFYKTNKTKKLNIEELKEAINKIKCPHYENCFDCKK